MQFHNEKDKIVIIDFGSQVTKLIARRVRDLGVYSEIIPSNHLSKFKNYENIKGVPQPRVNLRSEASSESAMPWISK